VLDTDPMLRQYVENGHHDVEGWFSGNQLDMFLIADEVQKQLGIDGAVGEIGVHHGRLFILLMLLRRAGEKAVAMDVFDLQEFNTDFSGLGNLEAFLANIDRHVGTREGLEIVKADSMQLEASDVLTAAGARFRMLSVDGSHTTHNTANDLRLAHRVLRQGGIIVVDDYFNGGYPMVAEGVARFMILEPVVNIVPVLAGMNKVVFTTKSHHTQYLEAFRALKVSGGGWLSEREFYGVPCICF
jgi:SAM-dependent methyltransferase